MLSLKFHATEESHISSFQVSADTCRQPLLTIDCLQLSRVWAAFVLFLNSSIIGLCSGSPLILKGRLFTSVVSRLAVHCHVFAHHRVIGQSVCFPREHGCFPTTRW